MQPGNNTVVHMLTDPSEQVVRANVRDVSLLTSRCTICNEYSKPAPMSQDTWCYSFAKFLELRFHGHAYKKRNCEGIMDQSDGGEEAGGGMVCRHSLHRDFEQNFSYKGIVASFRYTAIDVWEIVLPAMSISLVIPATGVSQRTITDQRTEEMKTLAIMGYDVFVKILEKLAELSVDTGASRSSGWCARFGGRSRRRSVPFGAEF